MWPLTTTWLEFFSDYLHAKSYKVISPEMLNWETSMCSLLHKSSLHLHTTCQMWTLTQLMCACRAGCITLQYWNTAEATSVGNILRTSIQIYWQDYPFCKNFKGHTVKIWQLHTQNHFFTFDTFWWQFAKHVHNSVAVLCKSSTRFSMRQTISSDLF